MNPETLFKMLNGLAMLGWLLLIFGPNSKWTQRLLFRPLLPAVLALSYLVFISAGLSAFGDGGGFGSLAAVSRLFENRMALLAGWTHYLAFDLLVGSWIVADSRKSGLCHWMIIPTLLLTFLFGPIGWLAYQLECKIAKMFRRAPEPRHAERT